MAKKQQGKKKDGQKNGGQTNHVVIGLLLVLLGLISLGGLLGAAGAGGRLIAEGSTMLLGAGKFLIPILLLTGGGLALTKRKLEATTREIVTATIGLLALLTLLSLYDATLGGIVGQALATPLVSAFDVDFTGLILIFITATSFILFFDRTPNLFPFFNNFFARIGTLFTRKEKQALSIDDVFGDDVPLEIPKEIPANAIIDGKKIEVPKLAKEKELTVNDSSVGNEMLIDSKKVSASFGTYVPPPLNLLEGDRGKANVGDVKANANIIRRTLMNFGIEVEMDEVTIGPTVTRYALKPAKA